MRSRVSKSASIKSTCAKAAGLCAIKEVVGNQRKESWWSFGNKRPTQWDSSPWLKSREVGKSHMGTPGYNNPNILTPGDTYDFQQMKSQDLREFHQSLAHRQRELANQNAARDFNQSYEMQPGPGRFTTGNLDLNSVNRYMQQLEQHDPALSQRTKGYNLSPIWGMQAPAAPAGSMSQGDFRGWWNSNTPAGGGILGPGSRRTEPTTQFGPFAGGLHNPGQLAPGQATAQGSQKLRGADKHKEMQKMRAKLERYDARQRLKIEQKMRELREQYNTLNPPTRQRRTRYI